MNRSKGLAFLLPVLAIAVAALSLGAGSARADCCNTVGNSNICRDGSCGTPYCGVGSCNIFGCNCDGGCRTGCVTCNSAAAPTTQSVFNSIDTNHDGKISRAEFKAWAKREKKKLDEEGLKREFDKLDADHSGYIEPAEFDKELGGASKK